MRNCNISSHNKTVNEFQEREIPLTLINVYLTVLLLSTP